MTVPETAGRLALGRQGAWAKTGRLARIVAAIAVMRMKKLEKDKQAAILSHRNIVWGEIGAYLGYSIFRIISAPCTRVVIWFSIHI